MHPEPREQDKSGFDRIAEDARERQEKADRIKNYLLTLARRAEVNGEAAETISMMLGDRVADLWEPALDAAMKAAESLEHSYAHPVIDAVIAKSLREKPDLKLISDLYNRIPLDTVLLKETGLEVFRQTVRAMEERNRVELYPVEYLALLLNLVARLSQTGEYIEVEANSKKALELSRSRYAEEPQKFHDTLADSLETWAMVSSGLGHLQESLEARDEAINMFRGVSGRERNLAQCLNNQSGSMSARGDTVGALKCSQEAVDVYRALVSKNPSTSSTDYTRGLQAWVDDTRPQLAGALIALSTHQNDAKLPKECLASAKEAYDIFFQLAADFPDQFHPHLGQAYFNLGMAKFGDEDATGGLEYMKKAGEIYERLAKAHPESYLQSYAQILSGLVLAYAKNNCNVEALQKAEECVAIYQKLNEAIPGRFHRDLEKNISNLKSLYEAAGMLDLAAGTDAELKKLRHDNPKL